MLIDGMVVGHCRLDIGEVAQPFLAGYVAASKLHAASLHCNCI